MRETTRKFKGAGTLGANGLSGENVCYRREARQFLVSVMILGMAYGIPRKAIVMVYVVRVCCLFSA